MEDEVKLQKGQELEIDLLKRFNTLPISSDAKDWILKERSSPSKQQQPKLGRRIFKLSESKWTEDDLELNGIIATLEITPDAPASEQLSPSMKSFLSVLDTPKVLGPPRSRDQEMFNATWEALKRQCCTITRYFTIDYSEDAEPADLGQQKQNMQDDLRLLDLLQLFINNLYLTADSYASINEFDQVFRQCGGFNRDIEHMYPVIVQYTDGTRAFVQTRISASLRSRQADYYRLLFESGQNIMHSTDYSFDIVKLAFLSVLNLEAASLGQSDSNQLVEFRLTRAYIVGHIEGQVQFYQNMINLRDFKIPRDIGGGSGERTSRESDGSKDSESRRDGSGGRARGKKRKIAREDNDTNEPSDEQVHQLINDAKQFGFEIFERPKIISRPSPPRNIYDGKQLDSGTRIKAKALYNHQTSELDFLKLLNSEHLRRDSRNYTIVLIDFFQSLDVKYIIIPTVIPLWDRSLQKSVELPRGVYGVTEAIG
ncbi:hypothetical protein HDU76_007933 [Blyttiomyces sp. JEL0837]|nr:hypothetical protein HDU76_007933 [Blyttiomyces sp. JEL0837]